MIRQSILMGVLLASSPALADGIPYAPSADVPDYVANMTFERTWGKLMGTRQRIVSHHGGWVRVDEPDATTYGNSAKQISIVIRPHPDTSYSSVLIYRETPSSYGIRATSETGQRETYAGEPCDVLELLRGTLVRPKTELRWLSCLTPDGIEIGTKLVSGYDGSVADGIRLVALVRRPVSAEEVTPPADLLDVAQWLHFDDQSGQSATAAEQPPDFTLYMHGKDAVRTIRGHGAWTYDERTYSDGRRYLVIWNDQTGQQLSFNTLKGGGFERLFMHQKYLPGERIVPPDGRGLAGTPESTGKKESVLGEPCEWFDMTPNMADGSLHHCLTQDGIPLKIRSGGWGSFEDFVADELDRRDLKTEDILPPADVLTRSNWDFPG